MKFAEEFKVVPVLSDLDLNSGSPLYSDSINMRDYHRAVFLINLQTLGGASAVLTVTSGAADATYTSALTFDYAFGSAATGSANCDVLADTTSAATLTLTHTTYSNYLLVVEVDARKMDMANNEEWLSLVFTDPGGATGNVSAVAILYPRYTKNCSATALA